jgi:hypothetical protein
MRQKPQLAYSVSGPGVDCSYAEPAPALSRAITAAEATDVESSFYVRDLFGAALFRVTRDAKRSVEIHCLS